MIEGLDVIKRTNSLTVCSRSFNEGSVSKDICSCIFYSLIVWYNFCNGFVSETDWDPTAAHLANGRGPPFEKHCFGVAMALRFMLLVCQDKEYQTNGGVSSLSLINYILHLIYPYCMSIVCGTRFRYKVNKKVKQSPLHAVKALDGWGGIAPINSRPRH
jgi:hypothetical protein